jgi:hypothetical protein
MQQFEQWRGNAKQPTASDRAHVKPIFFTAEIPITSRLAQEETILTVTRFPDVEKALST